jgi:hypothetical protein
MAIDEELEAVPRGLVTGKVTSAPNPQLPNPSPLTYGLNVYERSGTTATTAILDIAHDDIYVANAGDGRCVLGWFNVETGVWRCDVLTRDHTADDPEEEAR